LSVPVRTDRWLDSPDLLAAWFDRIGLQEVEVRTVTHRVDLTPETAWAFVTGTGLRSLLSAMTGDAVEVARDRLMELLDREQAWELNADSIIATGRRDLVGTTGGTGAR
jgi:hypothetical protein